jgi:hypothetical protein
VPSQILDDDQFTSRAVLPKSMAVSLKPCTAIRRGESIQQLQLFGDADHERSAQVREVLDSFAADPPKQKPQIPHERIVLDGCMITNTIEIAGKVVRQSRRTAAPDIEALSIVQDSSPVRQAAGEALERLSAKPRPKAKTKAAKPIPVAPLGLWSRILAAVIELRAARGGDSTAH